MSWLTIADASFGQRCSNVASIPRTLSGGHDFREDIRTQDAQASPLQPDVSVPYPDLQLLVDHLARQADDLAELALRNRYRPVSGRAWRQPQERFREPA